MSADQQVNEVDGSPAAVLERLRRTINDHDAMSDTPEADARSIP